MRVAWRASATERSNARIGARGIETDFCVTDARDLVAGGLDDVGAGFDVGAMHGYDFVE